MRHRFIHISSNKNSKHVSEYVSHMYYATQPKMHIVM
jgi:hypothetical protein